MIGDRCKNKSDDQADDTLYKIQQAFERRNVRYQFPCQIKTEVVIDIKAEGDAPAVNGPARQTFRIHAQSSKQ